MKRIELDEIDRRILKQLQRDCSLSLDALAEAVALSRNACWRRVKRLDGEGVITRRVAILDPKALGLGLTALVMVKTNQHDKSWLAAFRSTISLMPEIVGAHRMSGDLDYVLRVRVASVEAYDSFYQRLIEKLPIADISASFVMEDIKETTELPF